MVYTYTPTYYSSLHDSITSLCKNILPFSFKKRRWLPSADHKLAKLQSDNLKWQQDSYHQILNLMGLHKEGILDESEVAAFRASLLETLISSPAEQEQAVILRDKLVFLQELLYAKCISVDEYHSSKRPLLQQLAVQGAEIEARDVIVANPKDGKENSEEEWSVIDLKDEKCQMNKENSHSKNKLRHNNSAMKQIKEAASVFSFASSHKKHREEKSIFDTESKFSAYNKNDMMCSKENPFWDSQLKHKESETQSILMQEGLQNESSIKGNGGGNSVEKAKRKPFRTLFHREQKEGHDGGENGVDFEEKTSKSAKKQWGFEGLKKWKRNDSEDETAPLPLNERSDSEAYLESCKLVSSPMGEGPNTRDIKKKLHANGAPSDFFIDKVLGDKIKKELSRIQSELCTTNPNLKFSNDQIEAISTKLPVDKADLKKFFPKYGDVVLDVVKKEFKDHVGEMESMRNAGREKHGSSSRWTTFEDDDENCHPNLFAHQDRSFQVMKQKFASWNDDHTTNNLEKNPFFQDYNEKNVHNLRSESAFSEDHNPFWTPTHGSSLLK
ncbi:uncharacterized protein LOC116143519 isoform X2 [Pistacia vera]|uniref:uncharacterized protein LOC116143519 isoform X2 n=1 Tax=Pistacia vera TaxID=55513 RepID=UPI00126392F0|nr:uncharacterized protein LOC116143519 isoform X2 [Pistacia vera]